MRQFLIVGALGALVLACGTSGGGTGATPADAGAIGTDVTVPSDGGGITDQDAGLVPDAADPQDSQTTAGGRFACGARMRCESDQACAGRGQGVCGGLSPDANGRCGPNCQPTECGGGVFCLCATFECVALPAGCAECECALAALPTWRQGCMCTAQEGHVQLDCPGA